MPSCIVNGCTSSSKTKDPAPVLHAFPPELDNVKTWLLQTKQDFGDMEELSKKIAEAPRGSYRMCSLHFGKECYEIRGRSFFLKKGAVPSIFPQKKSPGDVVEEHTSLKRSKRGANAMLTEAAMAARDHNYAGAVQTQVQDMSPSGQEFGTSSLVTADAVEVEIMPDSPKYVPLEDTLPKFARRKKIRLPPPKPPSRVVEYYSRQVHRSTNTDPYFGKSHKKISANLRPKHFSIGIQCNLENLPAPQEDMAPCQRMPSVDTASLSSRIRKMVLHRGRLYFMLV
ncbi:uncharacterized protein RB166_009179 [Leptodactylus fuscus]|uniref:uncharacterized protein LOC142203998 n=1 Tax=Leptodactylus fuscus TaxID=238119 RepID=UPI003F4EFB6A